MAFTEKFLAQETPSTAETLTNMQSFSTPVSNTETLVTCGASERIIIRTVFISNVSASNVYCTLWHDPVGTTYTSGTTDGTIAIGNTVLIPPALLRARQVLAVDMYAVMDANGSQLMCAASRTDAATFTVYGANFTTS